MAGIVLLAAHLFVVSWITLRPLQVAWVSAPNLHPLAGIRADLALGWEAAAQHIGAGLLLLAPLGILLPLAGGRLDVSPLVSVLRTTAVCVLLSVGIEMLQSQVPGHVVDVDSVLLNSLGALLAHLVVVPLGRARLRAHAGARVRATRSQGPTPTIPRVGLAPWTDALPRS